MTPSPPVSASALPCAPPRVTPYGRFRQTRIFTSLDGLRAVSIVAVIWHHTAPSGDLHPLLQEGKKGVNLFFLISGFLIVTLLLRAKELRGTFSLAKFWGRRSLRIFPIYYAVLGLYVILVAVFERDRIYGQAFFGNLPAFATFTSNWFVRLDNPRVIFYFAWSLAAEEQFYVLWPWIERFLRGPWPLIAALATLAVTQGVVFATAAQETGSLPLGWRVLATVPPSILLGVILAHLLHAPASYRVLYAFTGQRGSAAAALLVLTLTLGIAASLGPAEDIVVALAMMLLISTCVIREDHDLARGLTVPLVVWVGRVSYGMYLFHMFAVNLMHRFSTAAGLHSPYVTFVGAVLLALAIASLSYRYFERRLLRLKDRYFREDPPPVAVVVGQTPTA